MPTRAKRATKLAWAAGFIDGEGCITANYAKHKHDKRGYVNLILDVAQIRRKPLDELVALFGGRVRSGKVSTGICYFWRLYGTNAAAVLKQIHPYLVLKTRQAELALELQSLTRVKKGYQPHDPVPYARRMAIRLELKALNRRPSHAERLSESAPSAKKGDATVRPHENTNRESEAEMPRRLALVRG